ncbi:AAA family ATPase [Bacillus sp. V3B]|uniref:ATP-binding protein n=1 Tax=Bacillus sp. V3B TaxID=2804915 RepID=UPI002109225E|nr:AAA family ATPase [Bacillus sp. V3B]MCQ6273390.1 AAA family ATPase [Bacillus sp. V3B]
MEIVEIYIYGYGKFEDTKFSHLHHHQVFFGENEAGKSTIMSFIHSILFGFPTKQQSELRYEPKKGAKYGGQLIIMFPNEGKVIIERVKGKAIGDVVVKLENGRIGGEVLLKELLSSIDKDLYQSIFSFNLYGLQNVHQMKGEDLGRFLFSTGTVGSDVLVRVENELSKELDSRFKPNGRNPSLNIKLKELRGLRNELRKAEENNDQYVSLLAKKDSIEKQMKVIKSEVDSLFQQQARVEEWKKVFPLFQQEKMIEKELTLFNDIIFPENGLEQLNSLKQQQGQLERKLNTIQQRMERLKRDVDMLQPSISLLEKESEINTSVESLPLLEKWKQDLIQLQVKVKKVEEDILLLQNKIHLPLSVDEILSANTSIFMKEKTAALQAKQKRLIEKKRELDGEFQEEKRRLVQLESEERSMKGEVLTDVERQNLREKLSCLQTKETLLLKQTEIKERLAFLTQSIQQAEAKRNQDKRQYLFFAILFIFLSGWGFFSETLGLIIAGVIGFLFAIFSFWKISSAVANELLQTEMRNLQKNKKELEKADKEPTEHVKLLEQKYEKDSLLREQLFQLTMKRERQQEHYDRVIDRFEMWEEESAELRNELLTIGKQLHIPDEMALKFLFDAFQIIDELKKHHQERTFMLEQIHSTENAMEEVLNPVQELLLQFMSDDNIPLQEGVLLLKRKLRDELEKEIQYKEKKHQYKVLEEELKGDQLECERMIEGVSNLLLSASAKSEEHFQEIGKKATQKTELMDKRNSLRLQLNMSTFSEEEVEMLSERSLESLIQEIMDSRKKQEENLSCLQDEMASCKHRIQMIEDGGTYAELLHRYKQLKVEFEEEAREWARFSAAKEILQKTVNNFKQERLPKMLMKAEEYLTFLTDGNYCRILPKQEGNGFLIESKDHLLFEANELSQATTEQIYVALRLSLAVTLYEKYKFPIMIDDSFVNFDASRTQKVSQLLKGLPDHQILFFTCHEHLLTYFQWAELIYLKKGDPVTPKQSR